ncbi:MarR family winged helix-turn-helix transcriptional regulator [Qipengyuania seohaensis]|uniref:MarR family winged helix-turn-helix transcriptional regulator n=1 Tax=Qipengyuania seohaensis TaxID=266951 RepID=UPI0012FE543C|nr:MarR family transcriptional regulator [Qipengyuania seohaensis]
MMDLAHEQMQDVYAQRGLNIPVQGSSTLQAIKPGSSVSLSDLARDLGQSHQLVAQRLRKLESRRLVYRAADPTDGRKTLYTLTAEGERTWRLLDETMALATRMNSDLFSEIGVDLVAALDDAIARLHVRNMSTRFADLDAPAPD